jgi:hypothetical protein
MANIVDLIRSRDALGQLPEFKDLSTWKNWIACLKSLFGLPLHHTEYHLYRKFTERETFPGLCREAFLVIGRRGGKSFISALILIYLAVFKDWELKTGEGRIMCIASDREQAGVVFSYVKSILQLPIFKGMVEAILTDRIRLKNRITIAIHACSYRSLRGFKVLAVVADEVAFWRTEGYSPDSEVINALRPSLGEVPESLLLCISTPYSRSGILWDSFAEYFGKEESEILVWKGSTLEMNPTYDEDYIKRELERDYAAAQAEYLADWRTDISQFLSLDALEPCIIEGRFELPRIEKVRYKAFCDPSGGRGDSMTLSIGHKEEDSIIHDCIRVAHAPFDPHQVVSEFSSTLKSYGIREIKGDKYSGEWVTQAFRDHDISYKNIEKTKSDLYLELLPLIQTKKIEILDNKALIVELRSLERKTGRQGKDQVDHPPRGRDDAANALAGMAYMLRKKSSAGFLWFSPWDAYGADSPFDS